MYVCMYVCVCICMCVNNYNVHTVASSSRISNKSTDIILSHSNLKL